MNNLKIKISSEITNAMKDKNPELVSVYRGIMAKIIESEKNNGNKEISDDDILKIIEKLSKQREEAITLYKQGGREDLVLKEQFELNMLLSYLPKKMSEAETRKIVEEAVANGSNNIGLLMKDIAAYGNKIDKKLASQIAKELL